MAIPENCTGRSDSSSCGGRNRRACEGVMTPTMTIPVQVAESRQEREFALWSQAYDASPNPLLELEERFLSAVLPEIRGKDVLDVGCGTGRWLTQLVKLTPGSLTGVDASPEMLARARTKV